MLSRVSLLNRGLVVAMLCIALASAMVLLAAASPADAAATTGHPLRSLLADSDTDGDGLSDAEEATLGTDPESADTDEDGMQDSGEVRIGTDPLNPDSDGDGVLDAEEFDLQSDPLDPASVPVSREPSEITVSVRTCPEGFAGKDPFAACTAPAVGIDLAVYIPGSEWGETATTDAAGRVTFSALEVGRFVLSEDLRTVSAPLTRTSLFCFGAPLTLDAPEPQQVVLEQIAGAEYGIDLAGGERIECVWFNVPAGAGADPLPPVVSLPSTGHGTSAGSGGSTLPVATAVLTTFALLAGSAALRRRAVPQRAG